MWQMAEQMGHNVTRETRDYLDRLLQIAVNGADKQFPRIRKEYRMLTEDERARFHKALRALKEDTVRKVHEKHKYADNMVVLARLGYQHYVMVTPKSYTIYIKEERSVRFHNDGSKTNTNAFTVT